MVVVGMLLDETDKCERIMSSIFREDTRIGRQMIWRMHQFVYQHEIVKADMSVQERIVYECNRRGRLFAEARVLGRTRGGDAADLGTDWGEAHCGWGGVEIPPWATEEFQAQFKGMLVASAQDIVEEGMEAMRLDDTQEPRAKRRKPANADYDLHWDDKPLVLTVREMQAL
jgi:hypothetical protein